MYKSHFKEWGLVKNNTEFEVKKMLCTKFQRDADGKVSEFVRHGKLVDIGTYLKRKNMTEYDLVDLNQPFVLPDYLRCRTPTPPALESTNSPDLERTMRLIEDSMRRVFVQCHKFEIKSPATWSMIQAWGASASEMLWDANILIKGGDAEAYGSAIAHAFPQLEKDLQQLSPRGLVEILLGMAYGDLRTVTALCKYLAAYSAINFEESHPIRQIFNSLHIVQQRYGPAILSEMLANELMRIAEQLEWVYGELHPYVVRTWIDLASFHNKINNEKLSDMAVQLRSISRDREVEHGSKDPDSISLRYAILQLLHSSQPDSQLTRQATSELWFILYNMGTMYPMKNHGPLSYCYHSPVRVGLESKRCRRQYDLGISLFDKYLAVKIYPYFEEDNHTDSHNLEVHKAWEASASQSMSSSAELSSRLRTYHLVMDQPMADVTSAHNEVGSIRYSDYWPSSLVTSRGDAQPVYQDSRHSPAGSQYGPPN